MPNSIHEFKAIRSDGKEQPLSEYKDQVLLVVNTASKCGFTPQYKGLQEIYDKYKDKGFSILAFPCDQFGHQEPGSDEEIQSFCEMNFGVKFPLFKKIEVNGPNEHPVFHYLKNQSPGLLGKNIKWNFTKFLVGKDGKVLKRFAPMTPPEKIESEIQELL